MRHKKAIQQPEYGQHEIEIHGGIRIHGRASSAGQFASRVQSWLLGRFDLTLDESAHLVVGPNGGFRNFPQWYTEAFADQVLSKIDRSVIPDFI
jgi:hypothetical protein